MIEETPEPSRPNTPQPREHDHGDGDGDRDRINIPMKEDKITFHLGETVSRDLPAKARGLFAIVSRLAKSTTIFEPSRSIDMAIQRPKKGI